MGTFSTTDSEQRTLDQESGRQEDAHRRAREARLPNVPFLCYLCGERPVEAGLCRDHLDRLAVAFPEGAPTEGRAWWLVSHLQAQRDELSKSVKLLGEALQTAVPSEISRLRTLLAEAARVIAGVRPTSEIGILTSIHAALKVTP